MNENVFSRDAAVMLAALGTGAPFETTGRVLETSGRQVLVATAAPLKPGTAVRIEGDDTLLLGEICGVDRRENQWIAAVEIAHSLSSLAELERFNRVLMGTEPARVESLRSSAE